MPAGYRQPFPIVYVSDMLRSLEFYRDCFGFETAYRWPADGTPEFVYLRLGATGIGLTDRRTAASLQRRDIPAGGPPCFELCLRCDDTDRAATRLRGEGVRELRPPETMPWGERMALFVDPDGNPILLTADG